MRFTSRALTATAAAALLSNTHALEAKDKVKDILDYVDPLIGTTAGGHVFPGASLPFSMAKAGADTDGENQGGFAFESEHVRGFSHMHDSGTGGGASLGNFGLFPQAGCPDDDITRCKFDLQERGVKWNKDSVKARPGYFGITLETEIEAEMTVTNHSSLFRFIFPDTPFFPNETDNGKNVLSPIISSEVADLLQIRPGEISINNDTGRMTGSGIFQPSFGVGTFTMHFCADFKGAEIRDSGYYDTEGSVIGELPDQGTGHLPPVGAYLQFQPPADGSILARVGVSFMSVKQACTHAETEQPSFDFEGTVSIAEDVWRDKLGVIEIDAGNVDKDMEIVFWSGVYRSMLSPQDYTGENYLWDSDEPYYDSYYCLWDSARIIHPLFNIIDPVSQARMIRTVLDVYRNEGFLPDCRMSMSKGFTQGGSMGEMLLADAYVKGIKDGIDWDLAYEAMVKDAEVTPPDWAVEGRGGHHSWKTLGYIPIDDNDRNGTGPFTRSISRTVEYAYNDFLIALVGKAMGGKEDDVLKYTERSRNWFNLYDKNQVSHFRGEDTGFVGFLQPKFMNGSWAYSDTTACSPFNDFHGCYLSPDGGETYEGTPWLYTFYAPHDMASLVSTLGGRDEFSARLQYFHDSGIAYMGNEPTFLTAYQYHYAGRPDLSAKQIHTYIPSLFNTTVGGLPGNDDSGAMGSFVTFSMMGMHPVAGQDVYLLTAPFFKEISVKNGITGKTATIKVTNFDSKYKKIYVKSVKRDGKEYTKNWIGHDFFTEGGVLEFKVGHKHQVGDWGTSEEDLPPSLPQLI